MERTYAYLPGISLVYDDDRFLHADMDPDTFAELFAPEPDQNLSKTEKLTRALRRAAVHALEHVTDDDGGTCNFDSPVLIVEGSGMRTADVMYAVTQAGLRGWKGTERAWKGTVILNGFQHGQGNRRTNMAEAFRDSMVSDGYRCMMYYQMD